MTGREPRLLGPGPQRTLHREHHSKPYERRRPQTPNRLIAFLEKAVTFLAVNLALGFAAGSYEALSEAGTDETEDDHAQRLKLAEHGQADIVHLPLSGVPVPPSPFAMVLEKVERWNDHSTNPDGELPEPENNFEDPFWIPGDYGQTNSGAIWQFLSERGPTMDSLKFRGVQASYISKWVHVLNPLERIGVQVVLEQLKHDIDCEREHAERAAVAKSIRRRVAADAQHVHMPGRLPDQTPTPVSESPRKRFQFDTVLAAGTHPQPAFGGAASKQRLARNPNSYTYNGVGSARRRRHRESRVSVAKPPAPNVTSGADLPAATASPRADASIQPPLSESSTHPAPCSATPQRPLLVSTPVRTPTSRRRPAPYPLRHEATNSQLATPSPSPTRAAAMLQQLIVDTTPAPSTTKGKTVRRIRKRKVAPELDPPLANKLQLPLTPPDERPDASRPKKVRVSRRHASDPETANSAPFAGPSRATGKSKPTWFAADDSSDEERHAEVTSPAPRPSRLAGTRTRIAMDRSATSSRNTANLIPGADGPSGTQGVRVDAQASAAPLPAATPSPAGSEQAKQRALAARLEHDERARRARSARRRLECSAIAAAAALEQEYEDGDDADVDETQAVASIALKHQPRDPSPLRWGSLRPHPSSLDAT